MRIRTKRRSGEHESDIVDIENNEDTGNDNGNDGEVDGLTMMLVLMMQC